MKILTIEEYELLNENKKIKISEIKEYLTKIKDDLNLNFKFILTFGTSITAFMPIVNNLIKNENIEADLNTVILLTICALAIAFGEEKRLYKKLFEELRLRGVYNLLKKVVQTILNIKKVFSFFAKKTGKVISGIADMFAYTALFIPFLMVLESIIVSKGFSLEAFTNLGAGKIKAVMAGIGTITIKHLIVEIWERLKKFNPLNIKPIKNIIDKFKKEEIKEEEVEGSLSTITSGDKGDKDIEYDYDYDYDEEGDDNIVKIHENKYVELEDEWGSLGEYAEYIKDQTKDKTEFIRKLGEYLPDEKTDIRLANIINNLNPYHQRIIINNLEEEFLKESLEEFEDDFDKFKKGGKMSFNSFIKCLTALNVNDDLNCTDIPKNFSYFITHKDINREKCLKIFKRFRSLNSGIRIVENIDSPLIGLYWGVKMYDDNKLYMDYGVLDLDNNKMYMIGDFKLSKNTINRLLNKKNKPLDPIRNIFEKWDLQKEKTLLKIKNDLTNFSPAFYQKKSNVYIQDNCVIQGFYGAGTWEEGVINSESIKNIKKEFKNWVCDQKWRDKVLINIKANKFWIYFKIKIK